VPLSFDNIANHIVDGGSNIPQNKRVICRRRETWDDVCKSTLMLQGFQSNVAAKGEYLYVLAISIFEYIQ